MDDKDPHDYLNVPVTDAERARASQLRQHQQPPSQDRESSRFLSPAPQQTASAPPSSAGPVPLRFPSIHAPPAARNKPPPALSQKPEHRQYVPISPIHEELEEENEDSSSHDHYHDHEHDDDDHDRTLSRQTDYDEGQPLRPAPSGPIPPLWTPIWLRKWFLGLFALLFALFLIAMILLWYYDRKNDGFTVKEGTSHYAWAYAPTLVVVIVLALWRLVDHSAKLTMPFDALQDGPVKASESLLVDYVSKFQLVSLLEAIKNSHFAVITSITGFVLLKVITVFSTGLLVLLPSAVNQKDALLQGRAFSADSFDPALPLNSSTFSSLPAYSYYASMSEGMPLDNGITFDMAYSVITVETNSSIPPDATIEGQVDAFIPIMTCKKLDVTVDSPTTVDDSNSGTLADSPNISLTIKAGDVCTAASAIQVPADNPYVEITPERQVLGTLQQIFCGSLNGTEPDSVGPLGLLFTVTDITYQQSLFDNATDLAGGTFVIAENVSRTLNTITNVFCTASYTIAQVKVTNNTRLVDSNQAVSIQPAEPAKNNTLPRLSDWNVTNIYSQSSISAEALFGDTVNDDTISDSSAIFTLMALTQGTPSIDTLLDADRMMTAAIKTYNGLLSQYAHRFLRSASTNELPDGTLTVTQPRLRVNDISAFTIGGVCGILAVFSITLIFIAPRGVVPRDPSSIAAVAMLLTRSVELNRLLRRQEVPSLRNQRAALSGYEFGTAIATSDSGRVSYRIVTSEGNPDDVSPESSSNLKWWLPFSATIPFLAITLLIPLGLIAVLEVLQRKSDDNDGLFTVADDKWTEIYSHYIPGVVMLIVAALVNMLDFNIALFTPWVNLVKGNSIHRRSILNNLVGRSAPSAFMQALKTRNLSALLSIMAATLAAILTVIASGLYTVEHFDIDGPAITLQTASSFDLSWSDSFSSDNGAAAIVDLVLHQSMKYPQFTYETLAFPSLSLNNSLVSTDSLATSIESFSHILDAYRGNLRCEILDSTSFNVTTEEAGSATAFATDMAFVTATAALPDSCQLGGSNGDDSVVTYENSFVLLPNGEATFAGAQLDLLFGENADLYGNYGEERGQYIGDNPPVGCPSLAFTFGQFTLGSDDSDQVTTMICFQEVEFLRANFTFRPNSTTIDIEHPPVVQDGTVTTLDNPAANESVKSFDFRIENNLAEELTLFNGGNSTPAADPASVATLDIFFQAIINGPDPTDPASLIGPDNQDALQEAINRFYQIYMAQAISANMRQPIASADSATLTSATTINHPRLVQHKASKLILQIMLGLMAVFAGAAWSTTKFRHVLPCNPASLAGTMSLLAGSDLCHATDDGLCECCGKARRRSFGLDENRPRPESIHAGADDSDEEDEENEHGQRRGGGGVRQQHIPEGAEWMRPDQFKSVFGGRRYSMGWWRERRSLGKRRRFGVDVGERADGNDDQDWELGHRRPEGAGFENFMMQAVGRESRGQYTSIGAHGRRPSNVEFAPGLGPDPDAGPGPGPARRPCPVHSPPREADVAYEPPRSITVPGAGGEPGPARRPCPVHSLPREADVGYEPPRSVAVPGIGGEPGPGTVGRRGPSIMGGEA